MAETEIEFVTSLAEQVKQDFYIKRRVLSFQEYVALFMANPRVHARSAAQYMLDCFEYFGRKKGGGFRLFDLEFKGGEDRLVGQEDVQEAIYGIVKKFVRQGRVDHLIFLHGPNGSAKSTLIACIAAAMEFYSSTDEGALYRVNWVFPVERVLKKGLGFGGAEKPALTTFAYLDDLDIEARIQTDFKDHPLFLIPKKQRHEVLERLLGNTGFRFSYAIRDGDLSPLGRAIFDALLTAYNGDLMRVYQHVQVERFFLSRRFRRGIVTVEPQVHVDAGLRQITLNRAFESLPKVLQNMSLFEPFGDLVEGNRGMVEYNDLLKKPVDSFKYLLATCEKSTVSLPSAILYLDTVFFASSNDRYLRAFIKLPEWPTFKGRLELVRVPYLLDYRKEAEIYESRVTQEKVGKHIAPHTMTMAGLFAVLTRLRRPVPSRLPEAVRELVPRIKPLEKAELYSSGRVPDWVPIDKVADMRAAVKAMREEAQSRSPYEGEIGASPREIKTMLFEAALNRKYACLSPPAVLDGLRELLRETDVYEFLKVEAEGDYMNHATLLEAMEEHYLALADDDVRLSMGLASESRYMELLERYVVTASNVIRGEKVRNPITGRLEAPDASFLDEIEDMLGVGHKREDFRQEVVSSVGAWSLDHSGEKPDYARLFPNLLQGLREAFFKRQKPTIERLGRQCLALASDESVTMTTAERVKAEEVLRNLEARGYCRRCAAEVLALVLRRRYGGDSGGV